MHLPPVIYTVAPLSPKPIAMPLPMPRLPPVTMATLSGEGHAGMAKLMLGSAYELATGLADQRWLQIGNGEGRVKIIGDH